MMSPLAPCISSSHCGTFCSAYYVLSYGTHHLLNNFKGCINFMPSKQEPWIAFSIWKETVILSKQSNCITVWLEFHSNFTPMYLSNARSICIIVIFLYENRNCSHTRTIPIYHRFIKCNFYVNLKKKEIHVKYWKRGRYFPGHWGFRSSKFRGDCPPSLHQSGNSFKQNKNVIYCVVNIELRLQNTI